MKSDDTFWKVATVVCALLAYNYWKQLNPPKPVLMFPTKEVWNFDKPKTDWKLPSSLSGNDGLLGSKKTGSMSKALLDEMTKQPTLKLDPASKTDLDSLLQRWKTRAAQSPDGKSTGGILGRTPLLFPDSTVKSNPLVEFKTPLEEVVPPAPPAP